ncbi:MAG: hypothetical protein M3P18_23835, partial [Actinomycetota bacterium]|nr:hypothetical protein [Actinomycetota bacterium]
PSTGRRRSESAPTPVEDADSGYISFLYEGELRRLTLGPPMERSFDPLGDLHIPQWFAAYRTNGISTGRKMTRN